MNARVLLAHVEARGASVRVDHGDDGAAVLIVAPRSRCVDLLPELAKFKPELLELLVASDTTTAPGEQPDENNWRPDERERRDAVLRGDSVVANVHRDQNLVRWAQQNGRSVPIGRGTKWGNPFKIGLDKDGTRDEVCDKHANLLSRQPELLGSLGELRGQVLACYCFPRRCHGDELIRRLNADDEARARFPAHLHARFADEDRVAIGQCLLRLDVGKEIEEAI